MKKIRAFVTFVVLPCMVVAFLFSAALYAQVPGTQRITSLIGTFSLPINNQGPQSATVQIIGATATCDQATPVTVVNTNVNANSSILFTLNTVGGTVGAVPSVKTKTPGTGFTFACTASDTSIYNYFILG